VIYRENLDYNIKDLEVKMEGMSKKTSPLFKISDEFLRLLGYYLSEGSISTGNNRNYSIQLYNKNPKIIEL